MFWVGMKRILWLARMAWGFYATYYIWNRGPLVAQFGSLDRFAAWTFIVLFAWTPMLIPPTRGKIFKAFWAWAVFVYLPDALHALRSAAGVALPRPMYWPLALTLACGPIVLPWLAKARQSLQYWMGRSILRDGSGRKADWTFSDDGLEIAVDLANKEFRIRARSAKWKVEEGDYRVGPVDAAMPLLECSLHCAEETKTAHYRTGDMAMGMTPGGQPVSVLVNTGTYSKDVPTGRYGLIVTRYLANWEMYGGGVWRQHDGSLLNLGSVIKKSDFDGGSKLFVDIPDLPKRVGARLAKEWGEKAAPMIAEFQKAFEAALLAERKAEAEDAFLRDERAARERWAYAKESASRQIDELRASAGVGKEFSDIQFGIDGVVSWAVAADREGRAAIMDEKECWAGSLAAARARASVEVAEKGANGKADILELLVELDDPDFERERLAKRRFKIMRGSSRDKLFEWADRIQILSAQHAVHAAPES